MTTNPDDPIPMSDFTLGARYSSEEMYRGMLGIKPGDRVGVEKNGVIYTDTVQSVSYRSPTPAITRTLNRWQRMLRRITPPSWRKPLLIQPAGLSEVTVHIGSDVFGRTARSIAAAQRIIDGLQ